MSELNFTPTEKQFLTWNLLTDDKTTEIGFGGGAGGAKSWLGCAWIIIMCVAYPGVGYLMGRKELAKLKKTTLITFYKVARSFGLEADVHFKYNGQDNIITFTNGSQVFLYDLAHKPSDPEYDALGSVEITGAFIDESAEVPSKAVRIVRTRCGRRMNKEYNLTPKCLETFNPNKGHVYKEYYKPWKEGKLPEYRQFVRALVTDNPYVDESYIQQLKRSDKVTRERLLKGNFEYDDDPTVLMTQDAIADLSINVGEEGKKALVIDVARFGDDATIFSVWDGMRAYKWVKKQGIDTQETIRIARELEVNEGVSRSRTVVDTTGVGGGVADGLKGCRQFVSASAAVLVGTQEKIGQKYRNLRSQCYFMLSEKVNAREVSITADADITELIEEDLSVVKVKDPDKDQARQIIGKDDMKEDLGRSPDCGDTMMMRMYLELTGKSGVRSAPKTSLPKRISYARR